MAVQSVCSRILAYCALSYLVFSLPAAMARNDQHETPIVSRQISPPKGAGYVLPDGSIRIVTCRDLTGVINALNRLFIQTHPGVKFDVREGDNYSGMASLTFNATAFAPLSAAFTTIGLGDNLKIAPPPVGFRIAHASLNQDAQPSPLAVIVNKSNPLQSLSMGQVTRIFMAGGPTSDIVRWKQLGLHGDLANREIVPYGPPGSDYYLFQDPQVGEYLSGKLGGIAFNQRYRQMPNYTEIVSRVAQERDAIGITALNRLSPDVRVVGLTSSNDIAALDGTSEQIHTGRYPFDRYIYIYLRRDKNSHLDPFAEEYVRTALSPAGQHAIATEASGYIPLSKVQISEELAKFPH